MSPPVAALSGDGTSPLTVCQHGGVGQCAQLGFAIRKGRGGTSPVLRKCWSVRCGADMVSARLRIVLDQPSPAARLGCCVRGSCGVRPLRQSYITPHCPQCQPVSRWLLLWQPPLRALRVKATGRYAKLPSLDTVTQPSALPGRIRALRATVWLPCGGCGTVASVRRFAQRSGQWPAASHLVCAPPTLGPRRCAALALRWSARPPPRGSLSPAPWLLGSATGFEAVTHGTRGIQAEAACKPA